MAGAKEDKGNGNKDKGKQLGAAPEAEPGPWAAVEELRVPKGDWAPLVEPGDRAELPGAWDAGVGDWVAPEEAPAGVAGQGQGWEAIFKLADRDLATY